MRAWDIFYEQNSATKIQVIQKCEFIKKHPGCTKNGRLSSRNCTNEPVKILISEVFIHNVLL